MPTYGERRRAQFEKLLRSAWERQQYFQSMSVHERKIASKRSGSEKLPPVVRWLRTAGIAAELFGWGSLLLGDWFWAGVICIYGGFLIIGLDVFLEPEFAGHQVWTIALLLIIVGFAGAFTWHFVMISAPIKASAQMTDGEYPPGTVISGISWRPEFTEVNLLLTNPTDYAYDDVNILIRPSTPIAEWRFLSGGSSRWRAASAPEE